MSDAFIPQPIRNILPLAWLSPAGWPPHCKSRVAATQRNLTSLSLSPPGEAIRTMEAPRLPEAHRAGIRLAAAGSGDSHGEEVFIGGVVTM